jgi:hypothetical protein
MGCPRALSAMKRKEASRLHRFEKYYDNYNIKKAVVKAVVKAPI